MPRRYTHSIFKKCPVPGCETEFPLTYLDQGQHFRAHVRYEEEHKVALFNRNGHVQEVLSASDYSIRVQSGQTQRGASPRGYYPCELLGAESAP